MITYKHVYLFVVLITINCICSNAVHAQALQGQALADSLNLELQKAKTDTDKIKLYYNLATTYAPMDSASALHNAGLCMQTSKQAKWIKGIGMAYLSYARARYELSQFSIVIQNADSAYSIFEKLNDIEFMGNALRISGNAYDGLGYYTKAIELNFTALRLFESINNKSGICRSYNGLGTAYYKLSDYTRALDNYKKALPVYIALNDKYGIASAIDNIASVFLDEGKYDSANLYNLKAIKIFEEIHHLPAMARIYYNRGNLLRSMHDAGAAYSFYNRALQIDKKLGIKKETGNDYGGIGELYLELAKDTTGKLMVTQSLKSGKKTLLEKAKYNVAKALVLNKEVGEIYLLMYYSNVASEIEERLGNYHNALNYHKAYTLYKDSIFNGENKSKIEAMENERLAEVKDKQIQLLNQQKALEASEIKRQTLIRNIILGSVIVIALLSFIFIRANNKRKKTIFDKQVQEVEMKALRAQMNPHFIFNSLHAINNYVIENDKENASAYLAKFSKLMRLILENSREQEVPIVKDLDALELYIQLEALRFKNSFSYSINTDPGIDKENTLIPPLLLQPFVENAIIHGIRNKEDGLIKVSVNKEENMLCCIVEDNGTGRSNVSLQRDGKTHKSLGLKIINERLNVINQLKKVKSAIRILDLKDAENKIRGLRIELLLPFESAF